MRSFKRQKNIFPLIALCLLLGTLFSGCSENLKITTKQGLPCTERPNSSSCKDLEEKEIKGLNALQIDKAVITSDRKLSISWAAADEAKSVKNASVILSKDRECKSEEAIVWKESTPGLESLQEVSEGIYYVCPSTTTTLGTKIVAAQNGQRLVADFSKPDIVAFPEIIASSNGALSSDLKIIDISNVSLSWQLVDDGSGAWLEAADTMMPRLVGAKARTYTAILTATDEGGNTSRKTFQIISDRNTVGSLERPTAPSRIQVTAYSKTPNVIVYYTPGMANNFGTHNVKACSSNDCSTGCSSAIQDKQSPVQITALVDGSSYFICMQSVDAAGKSSSYVASANSVTIDKTSPTAPSSLGFASSFSGSTSVSVSFAAGTDTNFGTHDAKMCTAEDCSTSCTSVVQSATSPVNITGVNGTTYYACARSVDLAANSSAWISSVGTLTVDTSVPTAASAITVAPYSNATSVNVTYTAGTDTNFSTHNVKACTASDCTTACLGPTTDVASPVTVSSLVSGTAYWICLQSVDLAANVSAYVASGNSIQIDAGTPTAPSAITWEGAYSNSSTASLSWTHGSDANFSTHNLKACTDSGCSTNCTSVSQDAATPGSISNMTAGTAYYACLQAVDLAGNSSAFVASAATVMIDTTAPGDPSAVSVPEFSNGNVAISFTAGTETNPSSFNIKACTTGCTDGCIGATTTTASPGTISGAALTNGNSYRACVQGTDLAGNSSSWVQSSGLLIFDTTAPNGPSSLTVPSYSKSTSVNASFAVGADANMSTHNFKACTSNDCSTGCLATSQTATSPAALTSLVSGTAYYACIQALDLAGNVSSFSFTPAPVTIDTAAPGNPSAVSVPAASASSFNITFTGGTETNPAPFNIKACTNSGCSTGCVGATTTASSPGTIASEALTLGTSYYGCVQGVDLATNTSSFVASAGTVLYNSFAVTYNGNGSTGGTVPTDAMGYVSGATVTVSGNTGSLVKAGSTFSNWNTAANGSGIAYSAAQTFSIAANTILYAQWTAVCTSLVGGTYVSVPGDSIYGTSSFCVQKYAASNVDSIPTSQPGTGPWTDINQTDSIAKCAGLGAGYHLITNPEWMTIAANLANVGSNWSLGTVGSGTLRRGHSDSNPNSACPADASDANAYVQTNCTGISSDNFVERRTSTLSNGSVVWDIGGNVLNWINYNNAADKPTPATNGYKEYTAISGSTTTPKSHLVPLNSTQSWWADSWNSGQGIGQVYPGANSSAGALLRGANWDDGATAGPFSADLSFAISLIGSWAGLRCAYTPDTFAVTYDANTATSGSPPNDPTLYVSGNTVTVKNNSASLAKTSFIFAGWNTLANGTGTNYAPGTTLTISGNTILYAKWDLSYYANAAAIANGTVTTASGKSLTLVNNVWVESGAGTRVLAADGADSWARALSMDGRTYSASLLNKAHIAGRACPTNVFVPGNLVATGKCLYYDGGSGGQRLDASANDGVTDQTTAGSIRLGSWNTTKGGNSTAASWYEGNIQKCASKGMRLPTIYEGKAYNPGGNLPTDASPTPTFSPTTGVPMPSGQWGWSASACTVGTGNYWFWWDGSTPGNVNYTGNNTGVRCVAPAESTLFFVTYNDNGSTSGSAPAGTYGYATGATVTVLNNSGSLAKIGYVFAGWNTASDGSGTNYTAGAGTFAIGDANVTLYAKWIP